MISLIGWLYISPHKTGTKYVASVFLISAPYPQKNYSHTIGRTSFKGLLPFLDSSYQLLHTYYPLRVPSVSGLRMEAIGIVVLNRRICSICPSQISR